MNGDHKNNSTNQRMFIAPLHIDILYKLNIYIFKKYIYLTNQ